jgi:pimeloyl-ACP methyl ester carboxylesterase
MPIQTLDVGSLTWSYREALPNGPSDRRPVLLLHGLVSQSYGWRNVLPGLTDKGLRCIAPDWIGSGASAKPEPYEFGYSPEAFIEALGAFIDALDLGEPGTISIVAQGFLGSIGLQYALRNPDRIHRLAILNAPVFVGASLPFKIKQMGWPLVGDMMVQDPLLVDRTLEGGGGYVVSDEDLDIYRKPFLKSSVAGRALKVMIQKLDLANTTQELETGFKAWQKPVLVAWGDRDPWLPIDQAEAFAKTLPDGDFTPLAEVGHYPQQDWHEKVIEAIAPFLAKL